MTDESQLNFILTNRFAKQLLINNYLFYKNNEKDDKFYWHCKETRLTGVKPEDRCKSSVITNGDEENSKIISRPSEHNHEPYSDEFLKMIKFKATVKKRASAESTSTDQIYYQELEKISEEGLNLEKTVLPKSKLKNIKGYIAKTKKRKLDKEANSVNQNENEIKSKRNENQSISQFNTISSTEPCGDTEADKRKIIKLTKELEQFKSNIEIQSLKNENLQLRLNLEIQQLKHEKELLEKKIEFQNTEIVLLKSQIGN